MKKELCTAFCEEIEVNKISRGYAVQTGFDNYNGDPLGFYVFGPDQNGCYRIQDDGLTLAILDAEGANLNNPQRNEVFEGLLSLFGASVDDDLGLTIGPLLENEVPKAALRFVAFLLRVQDILFMAQERAENTFRYDVIAEMQRQYKDKIAVEDKPELPEGLSEHSPDLVLRADDRPLTAVFLCTSDAKVMEALFMHMVVRYESEYKCYVAAILETPKSVSQKRLTSAMNHLDGVSIFRTEETEAIQRIGRVAAGQYLN